MRGPSGDRAELLAAALASGQTWAAAAETAGVSESTVCNWMRDAGFRAMVSEQRRRLIDRALGIGAKNLARAMQQLGKEIKNGAESVDRTRAATALIDRTIKLDYVEMAERLKALEEKFNGGDRDGDPKHDGPPGEAGDAGANPQPDPPSVPP